jgi:uncharacterized protein YndB with AHSA1/START domain
MQHIELSVDILAPAEKVWSAITDWPSQDAWMMGTKVRPVNGDGQGLGGQIAAFTGIGKLGFLDTMTVTRWEPPQRCDVIHTGRVVKGTGTFIVESLGEHSCRFIWSEDLEIPLGPIGLVGFKLLKPAFVAGVRHSLQKFSNMVEQGQI